jgi:hypothetical protein
VYVCGRYDYDNAQGKSAAALWKNGVVQYLTDGKNHASAKSIFVSGNDVFVAGYEQSGKGPAYHHVAMLWQNGVASPLSDGENSAEGYSVFVIGKNVYVAGRDGDNAVLWKNGGRTVLGKGCANSVSSRSGNRKEPTP